MSKDDVEALRRWHDGFEEQADSMDAYMTTLERDISEEVVCKEHLDFVEAVKELTMRGRQMAYCLRKTAALSDALADKFAEIDQDNE